MSDIQLMFQWWSVLFLVGVAAFPLTKRLFSSWPASPETSSRGWPASRSLGGGWYDRGYFFSKAVGFAVVSYLVYLFGTLRIAPFHQITIFIALGIIFVVGFLSLIFNFQPALPSGRFSIFNKNFKLQITNWKTDYWKKMLLILSEEICFFCALLFWSWVKAHEPAIRGLEKFMDYGFMQSILNSSYFPAADMWWQGGFINYYYFGHLVTAVLTKLSGLDLSVTFNLMLATIFALTLTMSFSIGLEIGRTRQRRPIGLIGQIQPIIAGLLTAFLVTFAGNMQTIYAFTKGYIGDNVVPFWTILWSPSEFFSNIGEGMMRYWYANATRFIPFTIHEFPSYSFVVSDVHGHVLSIPFVLLAIAILIAIFSKSRFDTSMQIQNSKHEARNPKQYQNINSQNSKCFGFNFSHLCSFVSNFDIRISDLFIFIFYGFILGILLMTNALDGPIYGLLFVVILLTTSKFEIRNSKFEILNPKWKQAGLIGIVAVIAGLTALPFLLHFNSFATGIGVNCPPEFLANTKIGPFLFEGVEKCQKSPLWMMELLWGFFWFVGAWLFIKRIWGKEKYDAPVNRILKVFFVYGLALIIIPEFFYVKDIYPAHFRSNTMFKLGYQAFILWSITASYVIVHFLFQRTSPQIFNFQFSIFNKNYKLQISNLKKKIRSLFFLLLFPQLILVSIYPIFSTRSYFGELKTYRGIYGLEWLEKEYPDDWNAIQWLREKIQKEQGSPSTTLGTTMTGLPVIVEADGDSYTDYNHMSAFAGVPTVVGWAVHEWLWRGSYDVVAPRREDVKTIYESGDVNAVRSILNKYNVRYVLVGKLEREKFTNIREDVIAKIGSVAFQSRSTVVYDVGEYKEVGY